MNNIIIDFSHAFAILCAFSFVFYLTGHFLYSFINQNKESIFKSFFVKMALGLISIVIIYALLKTCLLSLYLGTIISTICFLFLNRNKFTFKIKDNLLHIEPKLFLIYFFGLSIITLGSVYLYHFDNRLFIHQDLSFYARLGSSLYKNGIEVLNSEPFLYGPNHTEYYHFFNEWLIALLLNFSNFTSLKILLLLVLPILVTVSFIGALNLSNEYLPQISISQKILLAFFFISIPGILSFLLYYVSNFSLTTTYSILQGGIVILKVKILVILLLLFFKDHHISFNEKNFLSFSLIPLFWNTLIPAFMGGYILYFIYLIYKRKKISYKLFLQLVLPIVCLQIQLVVVNYIYEKTAIKVEHEPGYGIINYLTDTYSSVKYIISTIFIYVIPLIILFLLILKYYNQSFLTLQKKLPYLFDSDKNVILLLIFITMASLFSFGILRELFDSRQILMNLLYPLINIILFQLFLNFYKSNRYKGIAIESIIFTFILFHAIAQRPGNPTDTILSQFKKIRSENKNLLFATDINSYRSPFGIYRKPYEHYLMYYEDYKPMRIDLILNTSDSSPKDKLEYDRFASPQNFFKFVKINNLTNNIDKAKIMFLNKFNINYLLVDSVIVFNDSSYIKKLSVDTLFPFDKGVYLIKLKR